jgi:hypothetical protein
MPNDPPVIFHGIDPDDPAEQGFWGDRDQPRAPERGERPPLQPRQPLMRDRADDEWHSER